MSLGLYLEDGFLGRVLAGQKAPLKVGLQILVLNPVLV